VLAVRVTVPVGVPAPGATAFTVNFTVTACPGTDGFGKVEVITVDEFATLTVWLAAPTLPLKLVSPPYVAVTVRVPALADASEHDPAPPESTMAQLFVPSETATDPLGIPL
jgi:hypothetical protein